MIPPVDEVEVARQPHLSNLHFDEVAALNLHADAHARHNCHTHLHLYKAFDAFDRG